MQQTSKEECLDRVERRAANYQYKYHGCARCPLLALQEEFNLPGGSAALKAAGFLSGGMARTGNVCGALSGAMMALGLAAGTGRIEDPAYGEEVNETSELPKRLEFAGTLVKRFVHELGSWSCRDIIVSQFGKYAEHWQLDTVEGYAEWQKAGGFEKCSKVAGKAARLGAEIILQMKDEGLIS